MFKKFILPLMFLFSVQAHALHIITTADEFVSSDLMNFYQLPPGGSATFVGTDSAQELRQKTINCNFNTCLNFPTPSFGGTTLQYVRGDGSLATFSSAVRGQINATGNGLSYNIALGQISSTFSASAPLSMSPLGAISITQASGSQNGYLSSANWNTFNNKEPAIAAGTIAQYWRGDKTFQTLSTSVVPEGTNLYYTDARVTNVALPLAGGTMLGDIDMNNVHKVANLPNPTGNQDAATKLYVDNGLATKLSVTAASGATQSLGGNLDFSNSGGIKNIQDPVNAQDAATKSYVDANAGAFDFQASSGLISLNAPFTLAAKKNQKAVTVMNFEAFSGFFSCTTNPTLALVDCGTDPTCASFTTLATATVTGSGTIVDGTIINSTSPLGNYLEIIATAGVCSNVVITADAGLK